MTTTPDPQAIPPVRARSPVWMRALLIASLAVNAAVVGVVIGNKLEDRDRARTASRQVSWIVKMVPEHRRDFTRAHFAEVRDELRASGLEQLGQLERIVTVIRAEPFAAGDLRAVLDLRRETSSDRRAVVHERLVSLLESFDPFERQLFADNLDQQLQKLRRRRGAAGGTLSATGSAEQ